MDAALVFNQITPERFARICDRAQAETGLAISGNQGTAKKSTPLGDVEIRWDYRPELLSLTVQPLEHPFGCGHRVTSELHKLVEES